MLNCAYIALGSNLASPLLQVQQAVLHLRDLGRVTRCSSWYKSRALVLPDSQTPSPDYINGVVELHTALTAIALLHALQNIENRQGRVRTERWGARTLDLDILLFNQDSIDTPTLTVPHPRMLERNFVLTPLCEINPLLHLPSGEHLLPIARQLCPDGLEKLR